MKLNQLIESSAIEEAAKDRDTENRKGAKARSSSSPQEFSRCFELILQFSRFFLNYFVSFEMRANKTTSLLFHFLERELQRQRKKERRTRRSVVQQVEDSKCIKKKTGTVKVFLFSSKTARTRNSTGSSRCRKCLKCQANSNCKKMECEKKEDAESTQNDWLF